MRYRLYPCVIKWKDTGETQDVTIATGDEQARQTEWLDESVFMWSEQEPSAFDDLGDCFILDVTYTKTKYRVKVNAPSVFEVMAFDADDALHQVKQLLSFDNLAATAEELGDGVGR
jgi:hypothetical protein